MSGLFVGVNAAQVAGAVAAWTGLAVCIAALLQLREVRRKTDRLRRSFRGLEAGLVKAWLAAHTAEIRQRLVAAGRPERLPLELRSQFGEDAFLLELFRDQPEGFFIEVGAFDGYTLSVTYALEAIGWTGVLIEPLPHRAEQCRARRPRSRVVHAALSRRGCPPVATFVALEAPGEPAADLMSHVAAATGHAERIAGSGARRVGTTVPQTTMDAVLEGHEGPVDVAVIDVEGGELDLLDGFDLGRFRPRVLVVEDAALVGGGAGSAALISAVERAAYARARQVGPNHVFVRSDEAGLLARAGEIPVLVEWA